MQSISPYIKNTYKLIKFTFLEGISAETYFPLLALLEEEMSDRNLAETIAYCTEKNYSEILNDIYAVRSTSILSAEVVVDEVKTRLSACGYEKWLNEE